MPHLERVPNIMHVVPGPQGALLLKQGDNRKGDLGVMYFPQEDSFIRLEPGCSETRTPVRSTRSSGPPPAGDCWRPRRVPCGPFR